MDYTTLPSHVPFIKELWFSSDTKVTHYGPIRREPYIIHYVLSGKGYFNGNKVIAGQGFLIYPNQLAHYYHDKKEPWKYLWIISDDENMEYFFTQHNADHKTQIFNFKNAYVIENIITTISTLEQKVRFSPTHSTEYFLTIYNNCVFSLTQKNEPNYKIYFDYAINYVNSNLHTAISIDSLCKKIGVSQPYLYNIFKSEIGVSPKQYVTKRKTELAEKLLTDTNLSISQIALQVGFSDVLDFSKFFKKETHLSPTDFRKTTKK